MTALAARRPTVDGVVSFLTVWRRRQTWRNVLYLALSLPLGGFYAAILTAGVSTGASLAVVVVGLPILAATLVVARKMATVERRIARRLLRVEIHPPVSTRGLRILARWKRVLRDPVTWKSLVFVTAKFPCGVVAVAALLGLGGLSLLAVFSPVYTAAGTPITFFGWEVDNPAQALVLAVPGLVALLLCLHLYNGLAWLAGLAARVMLGPSTLELRERFEDVRGARARIIEAADAERRRIERDLHDGAQQRLVALSLTLGVAEAKLKTDPEAAVPLVASARAEAQAAVQELRELARGIHPAVLTDRGLEPALAGLATRAPVPVDITGAPEQRLPAPVEAGIYFVVSEALTNIAKYAEANAASVHLTTTPDRVRLEVTDDGKGGASPNGGSGLRGLRDRIDALDGEFEVHSPPGRGTTITADIPLRPGR